MILGLNMSVNKLTELHKLNQKLEFFLDETIQKIEIKIDMEKINFF